MKEIEVKFEIDDLEAIRSRTRGIGAEA